jgi:serine/threonine-protein kinase HipA
MGKKRRIRKSDFVAAFNTLKMEAKQQENIFKKMQRYQSDLIHQIEMSFISEAFKSAYIAILNEKFHRLAGE